MNKLLVKVILFAAMIQLGLTINDLIDTGSGHESGKLNKAIRTVRHIQWRPISVFPEEAKRFR